MCIPQWTRASQGPGQRNDVRPPRVLRVRHSHRSPLEGGHIGEGGLQRGPLSLQAWAETVNASKGNAPGESTMGVLVTVSVHPGAAGGQPYGPGGALVDGS